MTLPCGVLDALLLLRAMRSLIVPLLGMLLCLPVVFLLLLLLSMLL